MNPFQLHSKGKDDRVINTHAGPIFVRQGQYYSVNEIRMAGGIEIKYEVRYKLDKATEFEYFGLEQPS